MKRIVILISGRGSNMQAILEARLPVEIAAVISNKPDAKGLEIAGTARHRHCRGGPPRARQTANTSMPRWPTKIDSYQPDLVVLAGFMRILTRRLRQPLSGPSDQYPSLAAAGVSRPQHPRARLAGRREDPRLHRAFRHPHPRPRPDHRPGRRAGAARRHRQTRLAARVLEQEHLIYPQAIRWFAEGRIRLEHGRVKSDILQASAPALRSPWAA